jgi:hypothetical protein
MPIPITSENSLLPSRGPEGQLSVQAADTSAIGRALKGLGGSIEGASDTIFAAQKQQEQVEKQKELFQVQKNAIDTGATWDKQVDERAKAAPLGAQGLTDGLLKDFDKYAETTRQQGVDSGMTREAQQAQELALSRQRAEIAGKGMAIESRSQGAKLKSDVDTATTTSEQGVMANPTDVNFKQKQADMEKLIDESPYGDATLKQALKDQMRQRLIAAAGSGLAQADPDGVKKALRPGAQTAGRVGDGDAVSFFESKGLSRAQAAGIVGNLIHESGLKTGARNVGDGSDGSDSVGIAQWNGDRARALKAFAAGQGKDWTDRNVQLEFVWKELNSTHSSALQKIKASTTPDEAAGAFVTDFERPKGSQSGATASHGWSNRRDQARRLAGGDFKPGEPDVPVQTDGKTGNAILDSMDAQQRNAVYSAAVTAGNQQMVAAQAQLEPRIKDAESAYLTTGDYDGVMPSAGEFNKAYGEERGPAEYQKFQDVQAVGQSVKAMQTLPEGEIKTMLEAARPTNTAAPGLAQDQAKYAQIQQGAAATLAAREKDPVGYVQSAFPTVKQAWEAIGEAGQTPEQQQAAMGAALTQTSKAMDALGIPAAQRNLMPDTVVDKANKGFNDVEATIDQRAASVMSVLHSTADPEQRKQIFAQMARKDPQIAAMQPAFEAYTEGRPESGKRLLQAGLLDGKTAARLDNDKQKQVKDAVANEVNSFVRVLYPNDASAQRAGVDIALLEARARLSAAQGQDPVVAARAARQDMYGDMHVVGASVIPTDVDETTWTTGEEALRSTAAHALEALIPAAPAGVDASKTADYNNAKAVRLRDIQAYTAEAVLRKDGDRYQMTDPYSGKPIAGPNGAPMYFSVDDVKKAATASDAARRADAAVGIDPAKPADPFAGGY